MQSRDKFRPFILAGVGVAYNKLDYKNLGSPTSKTSPMVNFGLGAQYLISDNLVLKLMCTKCGVDIKITTSHPMFAEWTPHCKRGVSK